MKQWFTKLPTDQKIVFVVFAVGVLYFSLLYPNQYDWSVYDSDSNTVQVFPDASNAKNYELPVDMDITELRSGLLFHKSYKYKISKVTFPNDGYLEFKNCNAVEKVMATCNDQSGKEWGIKVLTTPDKPEADPNTD